MKTLLAALLFVAPALAQTATNLDPVQAACGPMNVKFDVQRFASLPTAGPERSKALVYVVEDYLAGLGSGPTLRIGLDGAWEGATRASSYLYFSVDPGEHHLCTSWQSSLKRLSQLIALAHLTAEAGQTYYFRARITIGGQGYVYLDLERLDPDEGRFQVSSFPLSKSNPKK